MRMRRNTRNSNFNRPSQQSKKMYRVRSRELADAQSLSSTSGGLTVDASFSSAAGSCFSDGSFEIESEVGRDALVQICCSSLSRLLDFPDSQLEVLLGSEDEQMHRGEEDGGMNVARNIASSLKMMKRSIGSGLHAISHMYHSQRHHNPEVHNASQAATNSHLLIFGTPISTSSQIVLLQIITHMESFANHEGIFRKSGSKHRIEQLVRDLGEKDFEQIVLSEMYKPHDYASMLKQYFSEMQEPLFLNRHLDAYMQTAGLSTTAATTKSLQLLMLLLPPLHCVVAQHLLQLLSYIASCTQSKMDAHNLALVFAPTLFLSSLKAQDCTPSETLEKVVSLLQYMITNPLEIFEVPHEVQVVAERYCKKRNTAEEEDIALDMCTTSCRQESSANFHAAGQERAAAELASLYEHIKNMPDGPQKTHFLKKFECNTPSKPNRSRTKNKENFMTPKMSSKQFKGISKSSKKPPPPPQLLPPATKTPSVKKQVLREVVEQLPTNTAIFTPQQLPRPTFTAISTMSPMVTDV